jgi:hypothetical protein
MDTRFNEIQSEVLAAKSTAAELNALEVLTTSEQNILTVNATSKVSIWRLFVWIFSFVLWSHEKIVLQNALNSRPQNLPNFKAAVLNYHDGLELVWKNGSFQYELTGVIDAEDRKIIDRCAVLESNDGELVVKIAKDNAGNLEPVLPAEELRIKNYLRQIKVPGVQIRLINKVADLLKGDFTIYVDPQIIDLTTGKLLNVTGDIYPVKDAIDDYLANLEFNGAFVKDFFRSRIKESEGIKLCTINLLQSKFGAFPYTDINEFKLAESGYFKFEDGQLNINYQPYVLVNG